MKLFNNNNQVLDEISMSPFKLESEIQSLIQENINNIFDNYLFISKELSVGKYRIDTLCFDEENNSFVIIEYKKGSNYSVIDQGFSYLQLLLNNKSDFLLVLSEYFNKVMKKDDIDWSQSRIIFISPSFNSYQKDSINFKDLPFELWEIKRFSNDTIILDQHHPTSKENIKSLSNPTTKGIINDVTKEIKTMGVDEHFSKSDPEVIQIWNQLLEKFNELDDINIESIPRYITFSYNNKKICFIHVRKNKLSIHLRRGTIHPDGSKQKKYFNLDDPKNISQEKTWMHKSGQQGGHFIIPVTKGSDIEYIMFLIKQKYNQIVNY
jgi:hypothetical protein